MRLEDSEYGRLKKLLTLHFTHPLPLPLGGGYFETLFAQTVGGIREEQKLLFDVLKGSVGWSLKTLLKTGNADQFEVVIQRCDILRDRSVKLDDPVSMLGLKILEHFSAFATRSLAQQNVTDARGGFLLRDRREQRFMFFQERYKLYQPGEVEWRWANAERKSLMGFVDGTLVLRWYRSGTQLFGVYRIPADAHRFEITWRRAGLDETLAFFEQYGSARDI